MKLYHVTDREKAESIMREGFRVTGENTSQLGRGVYVTTEPWFWSHKLNKTTTIEVEVSIEEKEFLDIGLKSQWEKGFVAFLNDEEYLIDRRFTQKAIDLLEGDDCPVMQDLELPGLLLGLYAKSAGYAAIRNSGDYEINIIDASKIKDIKIKGDIK